MLFRAPEGTRPSLDVIPRTQLDDEIDMDEGKAEMEALVRAWPTSTGPRSKPLQREETRLEASEMLGGVIEAVVLTPQDDQLRGRATGGTCSCGMGRLE